MDLNEMLSEINETCSRAWLNVVFFFLVNFFLFSDKIHVYIYDKKNEREFRIIYQLISANVLEWIKSEKKRFSFVIQTQRAYCTITRFKLKYIQLNCISNTQRKTHSLSKTFDDE